MYVSLSNSPWFSTERKRKFESVSVLFLSTWIDQSVSVLLSDPARSPSWSEKRKKKTCVPRGLSQRSSRTILQFHGTRLIRRATRTDSARTLCLPILPRKKSPLFHALFSRNKKREKKKKKENAFLIARRCARSFGNERTLIGRPFSVALLQIAHCLPAV